MSTEKRAWRIITIGFIITTVLFGVLAAVALSQWGAVRDSKNSLQNQYNILKAQDDQDKASITLLQSALAANRTTILQLQKTITDDQAQISYLTLQLNGNVTLVGQLQTQITALNNQITVDEQTINKLQQQITYLQGQYNLLLQSNIVGTITATETPPTLFCLLGSCILISPGSATVTNIAWANTGSNPANNVVLTANFYDASNNFLCSVTDSLAMIQAGHSIGLLTGLSDSCNTGRGTADHFGTVFAWS